MRSYNSVVALRLKPNTAYLLKNKIVRSLFDKNFTLNDIWCLAMADAIESKRYNTDVMHKMVVNLVNCVSSSIVVLFNI